MNVGIVRHPVYIEHNPGDYHPERPERLVHIYQALEAGGTETRAVEPRPVTREELQLVHSASLIEAVSASQGKARTVFDPDTVANNMTYEAATMAAGGTLELVREVVEGRLDTGFSLVRPPGHHALPDRAMGFCFFNNIAIAAAYARKVLGVERVVIVDFDVHHGNGTQSIFFAEPSILFFSTHQYPFYPGSGGMREVGLDDGAGRTVNVPLPGGMGDAEYCMVFDKVLLPIWQAFKPQLCLVSAGFDAYIHDPLGGMRITEQGFTNLTSMIVEAARETAQGRVVLCLEGGYNLTGIARCVQAIVQGLKEGFGKPPPVGTVSPIASEIVTHVLETQRQFWPEI